MGMVTEDFDLCTPNIILGWGMGDGVVSKNTYMSTIKEIHWKTPILGSELMYLSHIIIIFLK